MDSITVDRCDLRTDAGIISLDEEISDFDDS
jgi:hypothetical protein